MTLLLFLLAATPPSSAYVEIQQANVTKGSARILNCSGTGITCTVNTTTAKATITVNVSDGGIGIVYAPLDAGFWLAHAVATLPNGKNLGALSTALVINTAGTPSAYAGASCTNQFPRSLSAVGAATCSSVALASDVTGVLAVPNGGTGSAPAADDQVLVSDSTSAATWRTVPNCTDTAGQHLNYTAASNGWSCGTSQTHDVGGSSPQVQYNNSGAFGGIANVQSDGTRLSIVGETAHPSAPGSNALQYDFIHASGWPHMPYQTDSFAGIPMPVGVLGTTFTIGTGTQAWNWRCSRQATSNSTIPINTNGPTPVAINLTGSGPTWDGTSQLNRIFWIQGTSTAAINASLGMREGFSNANRGSVAGTGGFIWSTRIAIKAVNTANRAAFGLFNTTSALTANADPNAATDSVYFGCNAGDTNLSICSNDNSGTATCNTLGANFPCQTAGAIYDFWLAAAPAASTILYKVDRLDSVQSTNGTVSSDLPRNTVQLSWQDWFNTGSSTTAVTLYFNYACIVANF